MCIYYMDSPELTYKKQEHVFPAGLGGNQKLPRGYVSDQANELFSPIELKLMRHSLLSLDRMMFGPGDRGSLQPNKASNSAVTVGLQDNGKPTLCYISKAKPYNISQINICSTEAELSIPNEHNGCHTEKINKFIEMLKQFSGKYWYISSEHLPTDDMLIGFFDNKYYVATTKDKPTVKEIKNKISKFLSCFDQEEAMRKIQVGEYHVKQTHSIIEDADIARVYAKIAMNTLALLKGESYAKHSNFDNIRNWIVTGESKEEFFFLPSVLTDKMYSLAVTFPMSSHWCIFAKSNDKLEALVCLYGHYLRRFTLGDIVDKVDFKYPDGFICDWQNEKEYTLMQYISKISVKSQEKLEKNEYLTKS